MSKLSLFLLIILIIDTTLLIRAIFEYADREDIIE
jgi:hypothetical protein